MINYKYRGTIIESSLIDNTILDEVEVLKKYSSGSWTLYDVLVPGELLETIGSYLVDGPWYMHFWREGEDDVYVVFKKRLFKVKASKQETWKEYKNYGISVGIPKKQLMFKT